MLRAMIALLTMVTATSVDAQQTTTTYAYDALGRLTESRISGGQTNGTTTTITYDPAGNRSTYQVGGSNGQGGGAGSGAGTAPGYAAQKTVIVVPLNGFTVIPLEY